MENERAGWLVWIVAIGLVALPCLYLIGDMVWMTIETERLMEGATPDTAPNTPAWEFAPDEESSLGGHYESGNAKPATKERYYRDSHGNIISETESEEGLRDIRQTISSMPDGPDKWFAEGILQALEEEWSRMKRQGPVE